MKKTAEEIMASIMSEKIETEVHPDYIIGKKGIYLKKISFFFDDPAESMKEKEIIVYPESFIDLEKIWKYIERMDKKNEKKKLPGTTVKSYDDDRKRKSSILSNRSNPGNICNKKNKRKRKDRFEKSID